MSGKEEKARFGKTDNIKRFPFSLGKREAFYGKISRTIEKTASAFWPSS